MPVWGDQAEFAEEGPMASAIDGAGWEAGAEDLAKDVSRKLRVIYCPAVCASVDLTGESLTESLVIIGEGSTSQY